eukprot:Seg2175.4 transcript_id=Seg2175.4/GoldUCD/mRNA.D3Y31 product="Mitogen-activated protein kinase kinase kinase 2" protein_id=Seg2175.4/GoldUCD/D3Y31
MESRKRNGSTGSDSFMRMQHKNDVRVKLEYQGERRIISLMRPVMLDRLQAKIKSAFGKNLTVNYVNNSIFIPIEHQEDLDKAIALLDQSPLLTSLRLFLTDDYDDDPDDDVAMPTSPFDHPIHSFHKRTYTDPDRYHYNGKSRPVPVRSKSNPEEIPLGSPDSPNLVTSRSYSMFISSNGRDTPSPPPGYHPEPSFSANTQSFHSIKGEGEFIPEDHDQQLPYGTNQFDPLGHSEVRIARRRSKDSLFGSTSALSDSPQSMASVENAYALYKGKRRPSSALVLDSTFDDYENFNSIKSGTYPRRRHTSEMSLNNVDINDDYLSMARLQKGMRDLFIPLFRSDSKHSIGNSSSSSGLVPDFDPMRDFDKMNDKFKSISGNNKEQGCPRNWKKLRQVGAGAYGQVYLCVDNDTGKEIAMKVVETAFTNPATQKEVQALEAEIQLLKNLNHERVVTYFGTAHDSKSISIFMEYLAGGSIHDKLHSDGPMQENVVRKYTKQILEGVAYLHQNMIIHRDIKGANILIDASNCIKLADFGASRRLQTIRTLTGFKSIHGTPYWMSPEVINGEGYGRKADVWSVGCTVIEMLTTKPPWSEYEPMAALFKIATQPTDPHLTCSQVANEFIRACLQRDSKARPSAAELLYYKFVSKIMT